MANAKKDILIGVGSLIIGIGIRGVAKKIWTSTTGQNPPDSPDRTQVPIVQSISWTLAIAGISGLTNLFFKKMVGDKIQN